MDSEIVVGLDIGTTKVSAVVGEVDDNGITVLGVGTTPCRGLRIPPRRDFACSEEMGRGPFQRRWIRLDSRLFSSGDGASEVSQVSSTAASPRMPSVGDSRMARRPLRAPSS